jgi:predicted ATPase
MKPARLAATIHQDIGRLARRASKYDCHSGRSAGADVEGLQTSEFIYEQPALGEAEYTFKHVLTQEVAYNSVLMERRRLLHERTGEAFEGLFKDRIDDHLAELAHHHSRSANSRKAVEYLFRAGRQAAIRSAYPEAITRLSSALESEKGESQGLEDTHSAVRARRNVGPP